MTNEKWEPIYLEEAEKDLRKLDKHIAKGIKELIEKVSYRPLPPPDGIGKPLGNLSGCNLVGCYKIKIMKPPLRIVYRLDDENHKMEIIAVGARDDSEVYKEASRRLKK